MQKSGVFNCNFMPKINVGLIAAAFLFFLTSTSAFAFSKVIPGNNCASYETDVEKDCVQNSDPYTGYDGYTLRECKTCKSGYELSSVYMSVPCKMPVMVPVKSCELPTVEDECDSDDDCKPDGLVLGRIITAGYEYTTSYICNDPTSSASTCSTEVSFFCDAGYYGKSEDINCEEETIIVGNLSKLVYSCDTGCTKCPTITSADNTQINADTFSSHETIFDCYVGPDTVTSITDERGTFSYTDDCRYGLGTCSSFSASCIRTSGTPYAILNGTKSNVVSGRHCWCNINNKNFYVVDLGTSATCLNGCKTACSTAFLGIQANGWTPYVSTSDLGCD